MTAVLLLYRKVVRLWWTYDDAYLLHIAVVHPAWDHFFGSSIWRSMPQHLFTPLLTATFDGELSLFGANARAFYFVQLALLCILTLLIFWVSRMMLSAGAALTAATVCILGVPMCSVATELMLVHYVESLALAAAATGVFIIADRRTERGMMARSFLSATLYFAAMLAKEIAVPLVAVLFVTSRRPIRERLALLSPHIGAVFCYALWRRHELGVWVGGYGWTIRSSEVPALLVSVPLTIIRDLSAGTVFGIALLILIVIGIIRDIQSARDLAVVLFVLALTIGPILPMAKKIEPRFLVALWIAMAVFATAGVARLHSQSVRIAMFVLFIVLAVVVNRAAWARDYRASRWMSDEARCFLELEAGDALRDPTVPPAAMGELKWLKEDYLHRPRGAVWFYDDMYLCRPGAPQRVFSYVPARRGIVRDENVDQLCAEYRRSIHSDAPLTVSFHHEGESLFWSFGPYDRGKYRVLLADGMQVFDVPRNDGFRLPGVNSITLLVRYESPDHWVTYSPDFVLDFARNPTVEWRR